MSIFKFKRQPILIAGSNKLAVSICVCLLRAGNEVTLLHADPSDVSLQINRHLTDLQEHTGEVVNGHHLHITGNPDRSGGYDIAIAITDENVTDKIAVIRKLEDHLAADALIAVNMESIALSTLQHHAKHPGRIIGANWTEPAHTTYFLEIITNPITQHQLADDFYNLAKESWHKDPYMLTNDKGIRSRMMCALLREAFYLIENNYVRIEDIDRACRNDAGYYLPFAGNFRYMDLMGTYMYGVVMQDLNPELSKSTHIPQFCRDILGNGDKGMENNKGFYQYEPGEAEKWEETFREFSYRIQHIIGKYQLTSVHEETPVNA